MSRVSQASCVSVAEAEALQQWLSSRVESKDRLPNVIERVAGADVAYEIGGERLFAAAVALDSCTLSVREVATHEGLACFPYIPGLFSFREFPPLAKALATLTPPDLIICDGQGIAHPRRFGLACHVGMALDIPTIGCAKSRLVGEYDPPGLRRGERSLLRHRGETIGAALRTKDNTKPVFVSIGHRVSLETACDWILRLTDRYRQPEPIRWANMHANQLRAKFRDPGQHGQ